MSKRNVKKYILGLFLMVVIVALLLAGFSIDRNSKFEKSNSKKDQTPYIEVSPMDDEVALVGSAVLAWQESDLSASEIYNKYSKKGKPYNSNIVRLNFGIYDVPSNVSILRQEVILTDRNGNHSESYELGTYDRSVDFEYLFVDTEYDYLIKTYLSDETIVETQGRFKTAVSPRIINIEGVYNMRDIGGAKTISGKKIKQGLLYRGTELDGQQNGRYNIGPKSVEIMREKFRIKTELDLRDRKSTEETNALGEGVNHNFYRVLSYEKIFSEEEYFEETRKLFSDLAKSDTYPAYLHCSYGKDRTGTMVHLLQILLGVSEETAYKQFELSGLVDGVVDNASMDLYLKEFNKLDGNTMQEKAENYLLSIGVTNAQIENIRKIFLEE